MADGITFALHVRPGGRRDAIEGDHDGALAVRVSAPPTDGRANDAVRKLLAAELGVPRSAVEIVGGHTSRRKRVHVEGNRDALAARLAELGLDRHREG